MTPNPDDADRAPHRLSRLPRRRFVQATGAALALGAAATPATADDGSWAPPPEEPIDRSVMHRHVLDVEDGDDLAPIVEAEAGSGKLLVIPRGDYAWSRPVHIAHPDFGIQGVHADDTTLWIEDEWGFDDESWLLHLTGDNHLIENLSIDSEGRAESGFRLIPDRDALAHRIKFKHGGATTHEVDGSDRIRARSRSADGHILIDSVVVLNRGTISYDNHGSRLTWSSSPGRLTFRNCKASGFGDNIIYTRMEGPMTVENCVFANSTPSAIRVGGDNEVVRNCTFWMDTEQGEVHTSNDRINTGSVTMDNRQRASNGGHIENCSFIVNHTPNATGAIRILENERFEVENCQFMLNQADVPGIGWNRNPGGTIAIDDSEFVSETNAGALAAQEIDGTYETSNVCIGDGVDPGALTPDSTDCAFDWDRVHPFPADYSFVVPRSPLRRQGGGRKPEDPGAPDQPIVPGSATTDFGGQTADESPADWTAQWATSLDDFVVREDLDATGEQLLEFETDSAGRYAISWDAVPAEAADVEILGKVRVPAIAERGNHARLYLRGGGEAGSEGAYYFDFREEGFAIFRYPFEELGTVGVTQADTWYWVRLQAHGTDIRLRYWEDGTEEPDTWAIEAADSLLEAGWVGVGSFDPEISHWDVVSVGWGGETAPMPE